mmetsp:Transcript_46740/g.133578  ORF Transcript_46740/g.133578 Transcript_46740/m.133578 type:complete len:214 (+) Transcript_46740:423-1064(+)
MQSEIHHGALQSLHILRNPCDVSVVLVGDHGVNFNLRLRNELLLLHQLSGASLEVGAVRANFLALHLGSGGGRGRCSFGGLGCGHGLLPIRPAGVGCDEVLPTLVQLRRSTLHALGELLVGEPLQPLLVLGGATPAAAAAGEGAAGRAGGDVELMQDAPGLGRGVPGHAIDLLHLLNARGATACSAQHPGVLADVGDVLLDGLDRALHRLAAL